MIKNKLVLIYIAIFLLIFNLFFFNFSWLGIGFSVFTILFHIFIWLTKKPSSNLALTRIISLATIILSCCLWWRSNLMLNFIAVLGTFYGTLLTLYLLKQHDPLELTLPKLIFFPFDFLRRLFVLPVTTQTTNSATDPETTPQSKKQLDKALISTIFKGIVIALPVLVLLIIILIGADPIFGKLFQLNLSLESLTDFFLRVIASIFLAFALYALYRTYLKPLKPVKTPTLTKYHGLENLILVSSIALLFLVFLVIQFKYLFIAIDEAALLSLNIGFKTYSEYAQQGFAHLLFAASIVIGVLMFIINQLKFSKYQKYQKILNFALIIETGVLLASAAKRWSLYYEAHGLTQIRFFGFFFLIWLIGWLLVLAFQTYSWRWQNLSTQAFLTFSWLLIMSMSLVNPDSLIANHHQPTINSQIDYYYLSQLGHDGDSFIPQALTNYNQQIAHWQSTLDEEAYCQAYNQDSLKNYLLVKWQQGQPLRLKYLPFPEAVSLQQEQQLLLFGQGDEKYQRQVLKDYRHWNDFNLSTYQSYKKHFTGQNLTNFELTIKRINQDQERCHEQ